MNQIHEMDAFVGDLIQELEARDERTVLVLYGDHLPALGLEAENMESSSLYRTEYIIWDNFGLEQQDEPWRPISSPPLCWAAWASPPADDRLPADLPGGAYIPGGPADAAI